MKRIFKNLNLLIFIFSIFLLKNIEAQNCTVNAGLDVTTCVGSSVILEGNVGGNFNANSLIWSQISGPNTATFSNATSLSTTISGLIAGTYTFRITATCQIGGNATDNVIVNVLAGATPVAPTFINYGCYSPNAVINLLGTAPANHSLTWTVSSNTAPSAGSFNGTTSSSATGNNPTLQFAAPSNAWCSNSYATANINVKSTNTITGCTADRQFSVYYTFRPSAITATADPAIVCGTCVKLYGTCQQGGTGIWTTIASPLGAPAVSFSSSSTFITNACNLIPGNYTFQWVVSGASCTNGTATVNVTVNAPAIITAPIANSKVFCTGTLPSIVSLEGNIQAIGETLKWSQVSGPTVTINNSTSPYAQAVGLTEAGAPYIFKYTISKGGCSLSDTMMINVTKSIAFQPASYGICNYGATSQFISSIGTIPFMHADSVPVSLIYEIGPANNMQVYFEARMYTSEGNATSIYYYSPVINITKGNTATYVFKASTLWPNYNQYSAQISAWVYTNNNIVSCNNILPGSYKFRSSLKDNCATYTSNPFDFNISSNVGFNAGSDQIMPCGTISTTLAGNLVRCEVNPFWTTVSKPAAAPNPITISNMYSTNPTLSGLQNGSYIFNWGSNAASYGCAINSDSVKITVASAIPIVPTVTGAGTYCRNRKINVTGALNSDAANGIWTVTTSPLGGAYTITPNVNSPNIEFTPTTSSTIYTLTWTVTNGCGNRSNSLNITTNTTAATVPDVTTANNCFSYTSMGMGSLSATPAGGTWSSSNPGYTLSTPSSTTTNIVPSTYSTTIGNTIFYYTTTGTCGTQRDSVIFNTYSYPTLPNNNFCNITTFPTTQTLVLNNITPYADYQITSITGPGTVSVSPMNFRASGSTYNLTFVASQSGQYSINIINKTGSCSTSTSLTVQVGSPPPLAIAGVDINLCGTSNSVALNALPNPIVNGFGNWSVQSIYNGYAPTFSNNTSPISNITFNNGGGDVLLRWDIRGTNVNCALANTDYVRVRYVPRSNAGSDDFTCYDASTSPVSIALNGNNNTAGVGSWSIVSQPATSIASFINASLPNTSLTNMINGHYILRWTITDPLGNCPVTTDDVNILVYIGCSILPLNLDFINAIWQGDNAYISWKVPNDELQNKYVVEKAISPQGPFTSINFQNYNLTNNGNYNFLDEKAKSVLSTKLYYRIKQLNKNNKISYSKIVLLKTNDLHKINIYPNLISNGQPINVSFENNNRTQYNIDLYNINGKLIETKQNIGQALIKIETNKLAKGVYFVQIKSKTYNYTQKIIIQ